MNIDVFDAAPPVFDDVAEALLQAAVRDFHSEPRNDAYRSSAARSVTPSDLYYNGRTGEINCEAHAPHRMTDLGRQFRPLTSADRSEAARIGLPLRCEICR